MTTQAVFSALSDPTRRDIIGLLSHQALSVNAISAHYDMTRPAIAKHLKILQNSNIIFVKANGRERINHLDPIALKSIADWLSPYNHFWDEKLTNLKITIENQHMPETKT